MPRPAAPHRSADAEEVRQFLIQFFLALDAEKDQAEALIKAKKTNCDGKGLYRVTEEQWNLLYGFQGQLIFWELQESEYGYYGSFWLYFLISGQVVTAIGVGARAKEVFILQDPSVAASALDKRIAFLQSKNLTQEEIDVALARAGDGSQAENAVAPPPPSQYPYQGQQMTRQSAGYGYGYGPYQGGSWPQVPPEPPRRDWRDWFIMATITSGVGYGLYTVAKRYVFPLISPPTPPQLEADKASIDESFNRAFALIEQLTTDTAAIKESESERTEKLDTTLKDVGGVIEDLKAANTRREAESRIIADQVTGLKDMIPKALEGWKANGDARLEELGQEVQSLKKLLENRVGRPSGAPTPTGRGYANGNDRSKDNPSAVASANSGTTTPNIESTSGSSASAPGVTAPKRESTPLRGFERRDRRAIPEWQMAPNTEKSEPAGSSESAEANTVEAGA